MHAVLANRYRCSLFIMARCGETVPEERLPPFFHWLIISQMTNDHALFIFDDRGEKTFFRDIKAQSLEAAAFLLLFHQATPVDRRFASLHDRWKGSAIAKPNG